jgi:hypothetical protein
MIGSHIALALMWAFAGLADGEESVPVPAYVTSMRKGLKVRINGPLFPSKFGEKRAGYSSSVPRNGRVKPQFKDLEGKEFKSEQLLIIDGRPSDIAEGYSGASCALTSRAPGTAIFRIPGKRTYETSGAEKIRYDCDFSKNPETMESHSYCSLTINLSDERADGEIRCFSASDSSDLTFNVVARQLGGLVTFKFDNQP